MRRTNTIEETTHHRRLSPWLIFIPFGVVLGAVIVGENAKTTLVQDLATVEIKDADPRLTMRAESSGDFDYSDMMSSSSESTSGPAMPPIVGLTEHRKALQKMPKPTAAARQTSAPEPVAPVEQDVSLREYEVAYHEVDLDASYRNAPSEATIEEESSPSARQASETRVSAQVSAAMPKALPDSPRYDIHRKMTAEHSAQGESTAGQDRSTPDTVGIIPMPEAPQAPAEPTGY